MPMFDRQHKRIIGVARVDQNAVLVEYSNNTSAIYTVEQLAGIPPKELAVGEEIEEDDPERDNKIKIVQFPRRNVG
jgi:hypothetical protein